MSSSKAQNLPTGMLVEITRRETRLDLNTGFESLSVAEALTFVPGVNIRETKADGEPTKYEFFTV